MKNTAAHGTSRKPDMEAKFKTKKSKQCQLQKNKLYQQAKRKGNKVEMIHNFTALSKR